MNDLEQSRDRVLEAVLRYLEARKKIPTCPHDHIYNPMVQRIEAELGLTWSNAWEEGHDDGYSRGYADGRD